MVHVNHHHHAAHPLEERQVAEAVSVVYVTAAKTFDGPIAGYSTPSVPQATQASLPAQANGNEPNFFDGGASSGNVQDAPLAAPPAAANSQPAAAANTASTLPLAVGASSATAAASQIMASDAPTSAMLPAKIKTAASSASSSLMSQQTTLVQSVAAPASSSAVATHAAVVNAQSAEAPTAAPEAPEQTKSDGGMSSGGKAGLAIGIIAIIAILAAVGFFFYRRKTNNAASAQQVDNEKSGPAPAGGMTRSTSVKAPTAPRLSMRAGNDALPEMNEKVAATGGMAPVAAPTTRGRTAEPEKTNPFGDHASVEPVPDAAMPKPLNVSNNSRPTTPSSERSATATAPPRGPDGQPLNVHRIQLDFAPSMDDELELRTGQLVRMLHEYDDGWCLCVRLDRSQQGVCPRSCISKQPVKPRAGPPPGAKGPKGSPRPTTPQSQGSPRARADSNATPAPLNASRPQTPQQGPFGDGEYRANKSPSPSYEPSMLSNSPNQSPPSSPEVKGAKKTGPTV